VSDRGPGAGGRGPRHDTARGGARGPAGHPRAGPVHAGGAHGFADAGAPAGGSPDLVVAGLRRGGGGAGGAGGVQLSPGERDQDPGGARPVPRQRRSPHGDAADRRPDPDRAGRTGDAGPTRPGARRRVGQCVALDQRRSSRRDRRGDADPGPGGGPGDHRGAGPGPVATGRGQRLPRGDPGADPRHRPRGGTRRQAHRGTPLPGPGRGPRRPGRAERADRAGARGGRRARDASGPGPGVAPGRVPGPARRHHRGGDRPAGGAPRISPRWSPTS